MLIVAAENDNEIDKRIQNIIGNVGLATEAKNLVEQLAPVAAGLDTLQSDTATIADACNVWLSLLDNDKLQVYHEKVLKRSKQALTPEHFLAYLLHPRYKGEKLNADQLEQAHELVMEQDPDFMADVMAFNAQERPYLKTMFVPSAINVAGNIWWKSVSKTCHGVNPEFCKLAMQLLSFPASSASIERIFSNFGLVETKLRNRLGLGTAAKLVSCYRHLRGAIELDW
ncbi:MAG: hAT transposon family protein [Bacteroidota bacterium]